MKDAPSCQKCGKVFPWNERFLIWQHKCAGSAESGELFAKPVSVPKSKTITQTTPSSTMSRSDETEAQLAAGDEDTLSCKRCGRTFSRKEIHLLWKHKCELTEVTHSPDSPHAVSFASNRRRTVSEHMTNMQQLFTSSTVEPGMRNETDGAALVFRCGKTFSKDERRV